MATARRPPFARSATDRVVSGVAAGIGERIGVEPLVVRLAFTALTVASGVGLLLYVLAWSVSGPPGSTRVVLRSPDDHRPVVAVGCIVLGAMLAMRDVGLWFGDSLVWPLVVAGCGAVIVWSRSGAGSRWALAGGRLGDARGGDALVSAGLRTAFGGLLVLGGLGVFLLAHTADGPVGAEALAVMVTAGGVMLILLPWVLGLAREAATERRARIRSEERAEIAAHLHDSVLNTLALIQRGEVSPSVAAAARKQERELRDWLNGRPVTESATDLRGAIDSAGAQVEQLHHVTVDAVVVGDAPLDDAATAIVLACQEAATNAAKHSGAQRVSIYVETEPHQITAFVRDQGSGFDDRSVPDDRRGIRESIVGRMHRLGGTATITSRPGEGTEVQVQVPRRGHATRNGA